MNAFCADMCRLVENARQIPMEVRFNSSSRHRPNVVNLCYVTNVKTPQRHVCCRVTVRGLSAGGASFRVCAVTMRRSVYMACMREPRQFFGIFLMASTSDSSNDFNRSRCHLQFLYVQIFIIPYLNSIHPSQPVVSLSSHRPYSSYERVSLRVLPFRRNHVIVPSEMVDPVYTCFWRGHRIDSLVFRPRPLAVRRSHGKGYERCTAVLVSGTLVMSVYCPTSEYDVAFYEWWLVRCAMVLREARGVGGQSLLPGGRLQSGDGKDANKEGTVNCGPMCLGCRKADLVSCGWPTMWVGYHGRIRLQ